MTSRYGGITGSAEISQDYENINIAFENVEADVDEKAQIVTDHINDNVRHVTEAEHTKLASIQNGAEPNQNAFTQVNDVVATSETDTITIEGGTGITVTTSPAQKKVVLTATGEATPGPHGSSHNIDGSDPIPDLDNLRNDLDTLEGDFTAHLADLASNAAGKGASLIGVEDAAGHFTGTNVEAVLAELFTFANDGKTGLASVIGSPATSEDTFAQLKAHIQDSKDKLATNLTAKGQASSDTEGLASLVGKVANIVTGKSFATGASSVVSGSEFTISGLGFAPKIVIFKLSIADIKGVAVHSGVLGVQLIYMDSSGSIVNPAPTVTWMAGGAKFTWITPFIGSGQFSWVAISY